MHGLRFMGQAAWNKNGDYEGDYLSQIIRKRRNYDALRNVKSRVKVDYSAFMSRMLTRMFAIAFRTAKIFMFSSVQLSTKPTAIPPDETVPR